MQMLQRSCWDLVQGTAKACFDAGPCARRHFVGRASASTSSRGAICAWLHDSDGPNHQAGIPDGHGPTSTALGADRSRGWHIFLQQEDRCVHRQPPGSAMHRSRQAVARMVMVASPGSHAPANGSFPLRHVQLVEPHEPLEEALSGSELGRCEALSEELQTRQKMQECAASPWGSSQTRPRRYMEHEGRMTAWKFVERWTAVRQLGKMSSIRLFTRCLRASVGCRPRRAEPVLNGVVCFKVHMNSKGLPQASAPFWKRVGIESSESFARFGEFQGLVVRRGTVSSQFQKDVCRHRSGDGPISIDCPDVTQLRGRDAVMQEESADL
eukprot:s98_g2.t1